MGGKVFFSVSMSLDGFHTPVFVVTQEKLDPWERPGGTTFHFVNDGIEPALDQAREAAGDRDDPGVRERRPDRRVLDRAVACAVGSGIRLFEGVDAGRMPGGAAMTAEEAVD